VSAYALGNPTMPVLQIVSGEIPYDDTFGGGSDTYEFKIWALSGASSDIGA